MSNRYQLRSNRPNSGFYLNKNKYVNIVKNPHKSRTYKLDKSYLNYLIDNLNFHIGQAFKAMHKKNNIAIVKRFLIERKAFDYIKRCHKLNNRFNFQTNIIKNLGLIEKIDNYQLNRLGIKIWQQKAPFMGLKAPKGIFFLIKKIKFN